MDKEVHVSNELTRKIIDSLSGFFFRRNETNGKYLSIEGNVEQITGFSARETINNIPFQRLIHLNDREGVQAKIRYQLQTEGSYSILYRLQKKDENIKWVQEVGRKTGEDEAVTEGFIRDVTYRQESEVSLNSVSSSYMAAVSDSSMVSAINKRGNFIYVNENFCGFTGYSQQELLYKSYTLFVSGRHDKSFFREMFATLTSGNIWKGEIKCRAKDRSYCWVYSIISPIYNEENDIEHYLIIQHDITNQKQGEQDLLLLTNLLQQVTISSPAVIYISEPDADRIFKYISENVSREIGYEPRDFKKGNWKNLIHPEDYKSLREKFELLEEVDELTLEYRFKQNNGSYKWVQDQLRVIRNENGKPFEIMGFWFKIDQRKHVELKMARLNEQLEQKVEERTRQLKLANRELEAFSYSVSHDLRAPLRSIDGFSQALIEDYVDKLDEVGVNYLRRVRSASAKMSDLIDDFLSLARVSRASIRQTKVNLSKAAQSIAELLIAGDPKREAEFSIEPDLIGQADPALIRMVLQNLLENAWKFSSKNPQTKIEFGKTTFERKEVYFVRDNGVGFNMKYIGKIFTPFQRLHHPRDFHGTGVGLATVQRIIQRHHGNIWAEGELGKGATFYFTLNSA